MFTKARTCHELKHWDNIAPNMVLIVLNIDVSRIIIIIIEIFQNPAGHVTAPKPHPASYCWGY